MSHRNDLSARARVLDAADPLASARERFALPEGVVYLDGNSLGPLPRATAGRLERAVTEEWGRDLIGSWNAAGWYQLPLALGDRLSPLVGAAPGQIAVCDTTTINLFKAMSAALDLRSERSAVAMDAREFPTNLYVAEGLMRSRPGLERRLAGAGNGLLTLIDSRVAVVALSQVNYRSGSLEDMAEVTRAAHEAGALVVWDLCHSAGVMPIELDALEVDFAVGCTYKYLNGGPGGPAWIYVAERHLSAGGGAAAQPLYGWMGHAAPFDFELDFQADPGIRGFLSGTPHILSMRAVEEGLNTFEGIELSDVRAKSASLTGLFIDAVETLTRGAGLRLVTPRDAARRGAQVAFAFEHGYAVVQAMIERGVIGDFRRPEVMRFGFAPLYLSHREVLGAAEALAGCVTERVWTEPRFNRRATVT